jgi:hypothetical protein
VFESIIHSEAVRLLLRPQTIHDNLTWQPSKLRGLVSLNEFQSGIQLYFVTDRLSAINSSAILHTGLQLACNICSLYGKLRHLLLHQRHFRAIHGRLAD